MPFQNRKCTRGLKETIEHEIKHLKYPEVNRMSHKDKEKFINKIKWNPVKTVVQVLSR